MGLKNDEGTNDEVLADGHQKPLGGIGRCQKRQRDGAAQDTDAPSRTRLAGGQRCDGRQAGEGHTPAKDGFEVFPYRPKRFEVWFGPEGSHRWKSRQTRPNQGKSK